MKRSEEILAGAREPQPLADNGQVFAQSKVDDEKVVEQPKTCYDERRRIPCRFVSKQKFG